MQKKHNKKMWGIALGIMIFLIGITFLNQPTEKMIPSSDDLYGDVSGQIVWEAENEYATYEVLEKQIGPYDTAIGEISPVLATLATVVRSREDSSFLRVEEFSLTKVVASDVEWQGGEFNINQDREGVVRISATGQFVKSADSNIFRKIKAAILHEPQRSETLTISGNLLLP